MTFPIYTDLMQDLEDDTVYVEHPQKQNKSMPGFVRDLFRIPLMIRTSPDQVECRAFEFIE